MRMKLNNIKSQEMREFISELLVEVDNYWVGDEYREDTLWGDTKYPAQAVRHGYNEALYDIETVIRKLATTFENHD